MPGLDITSFCLSVLGLILKFRYLLPRNSTPLLSALLNETRQLLDHAEAIGAVPPQSECWTCLDCSADEFAAIRMESNHAQGIFQQLLTLLRGLIYRLYSLYGQIEDIKSELELAVDKLQLDIKKSAESTVVPSPTATAATPMSSVIELTLPLPATT